MAMNEAIFNQIKQEYIARLERAGIVLTDMEKENFEVADFGLNDVYQTGLGIITYINTTRVCAKELVLMPYQTCPEHRHPPRQNSPGKEETFRCREGTVYLFVEGEKTAAPSVESPQGVYTVFHQITLNPGEQYTIMPNVLHWFRAGKQGAIISEFSTTSDDESDIFTDPSIIRVG